jgi:hypothetical protein
MWYLNELLIHCIVAPYLARATTTNDGERNPQARKLEITKLKFEHAIKRACINIIDNIPNREVQRGEPGGTRLVETAASVFRSPKSRMEIRKVKADGLEKGRGARRTNCEESSADRSSNEEQDVRRGFRIQEAYEKRAE